MNCDQCAQLADAWLDGELDLATGLEFERHLRQCPGCSRRTEALRSLGATVRASSLYVRAPAGLGKQVRAALRHEAGVRSRWRITAVRWTAVAAALLLAVFVGRSLPRGSVVAPDQMMAQEVLSAHLRSLMTDHLMDVASSDRHTVKPWFAGKLDFSPDVRDFTAEGFHLEGGRLEYLDGRPAAALVYRHQKHVVNVFIRPATRSFSGILASQTNGYHELRWVHGSMEYWAVSDASEDSLRDLAQCINADDGPTTQR
jgi:anti-sigma factor RsiW